MPYLLSYQQVTGRQYVPNVSLPPFCGLFCDEVNWPTKWHRKAYGTAVLLLQFLIPTVMIAYCYAAILHKVSREMICQHQQFSQALTTEQRTDQLSRRKRVNYILIAMVATFICCWLPLTLLNVTRDMSE